MVKKKVNSKIKRNKNKVKAKMNKETIAAADFQRKSYAKPRIKVVEIEGADLICTSGASTQSLDEDDFDWDS